MPRSRARTLLVSVGLLVLTNGPVFFLTDRVLGGELGWEEPFTREMFVVVALVAVGAVLLDPWRADGRRLSRPSPVASAAIVAFTGWAVISSFWSLAPELTRGRSLIYGGLAAFAWVYADLGFRAQRAALALAVWTGVGASVVALVVSDNVSRNINDDWRGIYTNRNSLAPVAGVAVIMAVSYAAERRGVVRWLAGAGSVIAAGVMWGSGSRTSALALVLGVTVATILVGTRLAQRRYGPAASAAGLGFGLLASAVGVAVIARAWEESTFVQRRTIWDLVWDQIGERPLHGHGWFSIWTIPEFTSQHRLLGRGSAHGSFLEVWLGVGVVGLVLFLVIVALALVWVIRTAWRDPGVASWTWLVLVLFLFGVSLTESFVLWFSYNWVLLMAAALQSGVGARRRSDRRTAAPSEPAIASGR